MQYSPFAMRAILWQFHLDSQLIVREVFDLLFLLSTKRQQSDSRLTPLIATLPAMLPVGLPLATRRCDSNWKSTSLTRRSVLTYGRRASCDQVAYLWETCGARRLLRSATDVRPVSRSSYRRRFAGGHAGNPGIRRLRVAGPSVTPSTRAPKCWCAELLY